MSLVRPECRCCGAKTEQLAVVSDPWTDARYGICHPLWKSMNEQLIAAWAVQPTAEEVGSPSKEKEPSA